MEISPLVDNKPRLDPDTLPVTSGDSGVRVGACAVKYSLCCVPPTKLLTTSLLHNYLNKDYWLPVMVIIAVKLSVVKKLNRVSLCKVPNVTALVQYYTMNESAAFMSFHYCTLIFISTT